MVISSSSKSPIFWIVACWAFLLTLAIDIPQFPADSSYTELLNVSLSARKQAKNYEELILGNGVTFGLQRLATSGDDSLRLLEITNGSLIVQLVFAPSEVFVDCDVSNSRQQIHRLTKHISSKLLKASKYVEVKLSPRKLQELLDINRWVDACTELHTDKLRRTETLPPAEKQSPTQSLPESVMVPRLQQSAEAYQIPEQTKPSQEPETHRPKRGITSLIYPGTKWCGRGNSAKHYDDLGLMKYTDMCCRQHDQCAEVILPLSASYSYFNYGILTISSCRCDRTFRHCLQNAAYRKNDALADLIGHLYFNVIGMKCFILEEKNQCAESSWWGRCLKREKRLAATFKEILTY